MAEFTYGTITVILPDHLVPPAKAGEMDALEVLRIPKAPTGLGRICNKAAEAIEKAGVGFMLPEGVSAQSLRDAGQKSEDIEHAIRDGEVVIRILKQANLLFDHDAYEQLRKVNDQARTQAKHKPGLWSTFYDVVQFFRNLRRRRPPSLPTEPQNPTPPPTELPPPTPAGGASSPAEGTPTSTPTTSS